MIQEEKKLPITLWLNNDNYDLDIEENTYSVTTLLKPAKEIVLYKRHCLELQKEASISQKIGVAIHNDISFSLANYKELMLSQGFDDFIVDNTKIVVEKRSEREFLKAKISGKFDIVYDGMVYDIKTTSVYKYMSGDAKDYILQLSLYKWLNPDLITAKKGVIVYIFTDYSKFSSNKKEGYPKDKLVFEEYDLLSAEEVEEFISNKLIKIRQMEKMEDEKDYPPCSQEERWKKPDVFAYYNNEFKQETSAATKLFTDKNEAYDYLSLKGCGKIVIRKGAFVKCQYCSANSICVQNKNDYVKDVIRHQYI